MALFQLLLFILAGLAISAMFSGFLLARRMGMYLMMQVMMLMFAMFVSLGILAFGMFSASATAAQFDIMHLLIIVDLVLVLLAVLMEFVQVLPILMKTMQGAPMHSSHITNLLVLFFYLLGLVLFYVDLAAM
ncbi:MAG: hypothetical protein K9W43_11240 [Candidatus Thorarchaeota archaeon]|nr:hypothetical protein [Candidatus Thorarchaeota archaeon]